MTTLVQRPVRPPRRFDTKPRGRNGPDVSRLTYREVFGSFAVWIGVTLMANGLERGIRHIRHGRAAPQTGWLAYVGVVLCAVSVPARYGRAVNFSSFYNAGGRGPVLMANFRPALWFSSVSVALPRRRDAWP
jgi:hypothetical protein